MTTDTNTTQANSDFSNLYCSALVLFQVFSGGTNWHLIIEGYFMSAHPSAYSYCTHIVHTLDTLCSVHPYEYCPYRSLTAVMTTTSMWDGLFFIVYFFITNLVALSLMVGVFIESFLVVR